jgi:hypothetical protein
MPKQQLSPYFLAEGSAWLRAVACRTCDVTAGLCFCFLTSFLCTDFVLFVNISQTLHFEPNC